MLNEATNEDTLYGDIEFSLTDDEINRTAHVVKSMAHPLRLKLMCILDESEKSVQELTEMVGNTSQSNISQHLSHLLERNILTNRKMGNQVIYRIKDPRLIKVISIMRSVYCETSFN